MNHRTFTDRHGATWEVWEVRPAYLDRRGGGDRRSVPRPSLERRVRPTPTARLGDVLDDGWLCFETGSIKRRLAPIPPRWYELPDRDLEALCDTAVRVSRLSGETGVEDRR